MKKLTCLKLLSALLLGCSVPLTHSLAADIPPSHIVLAASPKYPSSEKSENSETESTGDTASRSRWLIEAQYASIAEFRAQSGGRPQCPS
ncbi:hypothetical protein PHLH4_41210 [Pseudomonas sp. St316]|nr:hypothetical protein PHLH4_41210 [Pseudomonas sp. St316]